MSPKLFVSAVGVGGSNVNLDNILLGRAEQLGSTPREHNTKTPQTADKAMHILVCHLDLASNCVSWKTEKKNSRAMTVTSL